MMREWTNQPAESFLGMSFPKSGYPFRGNICLHSYFAGEIIGNLLELEPRRWRRPRRVDSHHNKERVSKFKAQYDKFDWTAMIGKS